ncbi:hypothetical protein LCGC14_2084840, partial [marine sediment metagenome]
MKALDFGNGWYVVEPTLKTFG